MSGLLRLIGHIGIPAAIGAAASTFYNMPTGEGAKQAVLAALPFAAISDTLIKEDVEKCFDFCADRRYLVPIVAGGTMALTYLLGTFGMEYLTGQDLNQGFTSVVGGIEGVLFGMYTSLKGKSERNKIR